MRSLHVVVPDTVDDPRRPSGGNTYDRRVCAELVDLGWAVHLHPVAGTWPRPDPAAHAALERVLAGLPDGTTVLLDGLVATCSPSVVVPESSRLRVAVLVHLPLGAQPGGTGDDGRAEGERAVLAAAGAVVTTSEWTRQWLLDHEATTPERVRVCEPGADPAPIAPGSASGGELLCVAALVPAKGHDLLVTALAELRELPWTCTLVGSLDLDLDSAFVGGLREHCARAGIADRVRLVGPEVPQEVGRRYAAADLLVLPSRLETYGLVVTEALARGLPVTVSEVGGVREALGSTSDGESPGLLVAPGDAAALTEALRAWLADERLRHRLRRAARARRLTLRTWSTTARELDHVLAGLATGHEPPGPVIRDTH